VSPKKEAPKQAPFQAKKGGNQKVSKSVIVSRDKKIPPPSVQEDASVNISATNQSQVGGPTTVQGTFDGAGDQILTLNVGGTHTIMTSLKVLCQVRETKLNQLFQNVNELQRMPDGALFLDRDGPSFQTLVNYLRNEREEIPAFDTSKDEHLFYKELNFWGFPDADYLQKRLRFPQELLDLFRVEPGAGASVADEAVPTIDEQVRERWRVLGPLSLYDLVARNEEDPEFVKSKGKPIDDSLKITLIEDSIKIYYGQVDHENKRSGFGRYISLFNGSIYEGHCRGGQ